LTNTGKYGIFYTVSTNYLIRFEYYAENMDERRKYPRINISFPVECKMLQSRDYFYTVSKDLSLVGAKIVCNEFLPKNDFMKLSLNFINKILDVKARVVWSSQERASERFSTGVEFVELAPQARDELTRFIAVTQGS